MFLYLLLCLRGSGTMASAGSRCFHDPVWFTLITRSIMVNLLALYDNPHKGLDEVEFQEKSKFVASIPTS